MDWKRKRYSRTLYLGAGEEHRLAISMSQMESEALQRAAQRLGLGSMNALFRAALAWHKERNYPDLDLGQGPDRWVRYLAHLERAGMVPRGTRSRWLIQLAKDYARHARAKAGKEVAGV